MHNNFLRTANLKSEGRTPDNIPVDLNEKRTLQGRFAFIDAGPKKVPAILLTFDNGKQGVIYIKNGASFTKEEPLIDALSNSCAAAGIKLPVVTDETDEPPEVKPSADEVKPPVDSTTKF